MHAQTTPSYLKDFSIDVLLIFTPHKIIMRSKQTLTQLVVFLL